VLLLRVVAGARLHARRARAPPPRRAGATRALDHIRAAEQLWTERFGHVWEFDDLAILTDAGITLGRPDAAVDRAAAAGRAHCESDLNATTSHISRRP
jgi:hypothetical protein